MRGSERMVIVIVLSLIFSFGFLCLPLGVSRQVDVPRGKHCCPYGAVGSWKYRKGEKFYGRRERGSDQGEASVFF